MLSKPRLRTYRLVPKKSGKRKQNIFELKGFFLVKIFAKERKLEEILVHSNKLALINTHVPQYIPLFIYILTMKEKKMISGI